LALLAVANLLLGVGLFAIRSPVKVMVVAAPPPALPAQIKELEALMDGNHKGQLFTLTLTDAELTDAVAVYLASSSDVAFTDVRITIRRTEIEVNARSSGTPIVVPVRVKLTAAVANGRPDLKVRDVSLGSAGLPGFVTDQVIQQANASLDTVGLRPRRDAAIAHVRRWRGHRDGDDQLRSTK
jgi:uncharacterized protein YpmS